jgi:hypothetical protein
VEDEDWDLGQLVVGFQGSGVFAMRGMVSVFWTKADFAVQHTPRIRYAALRVRMHCLPSPHREDPEVF